MTEIAIKNVSESSDEATQREPSARRASTRSRANLVRLLQSQGLVLMLGAIIFFFTVRSDFFLTWSNARIIAGTSAALGIMAIGQTYLIISGGIDISVGSVVALSTVTTGIMFGNGWPFWPAVLIAVLAGAAVGAVNALIVVALKIDPFIATLGTMSLFAGVAFTITSGETRVVNNSTLAHVGIGRLGVLPVSFVVFLVVFAIALIVEKFTAAGRTIYAIGGNPEAARLSGLHVRTTQTILYIVSGATAGIAGVLITAQLAAASPQVGGTFLLEVVTAVILGGASLAGGRGSVLGTVVAVAILSTLNNGFAQLGWSSSAQNIALGIALVVAVLLDQFGRRSHGVAP